ncbi:MAG TPA: S41 family peptidase [Thermotogota bacterium]|nr:S41 family peptidase [Thermotogota bacterium]
MKKTLITYAVSLFLLATILVGLSLFWSDLLPRWNLNRELKKVALDLHTKHLERLPPGVAPEVSRDALFQKARELVAELPLFSSKFRYALSLGELVNEVGDPFTFFTIPREFLLKNRVLPMKTRWTAGGLQLLETPFGKIPPGAFILEINDQPVTLWLEKLSALAYAPNPQVRNFWIVERGWFAWLPSFFDFSRAKVLYRFAGTQKVTDVDCIALEDWNTQSEPFFSLEQREDTAVLTLRAFSMEPGFLFALRDKMDTLNQNGVKHLLIDLRNARGQNPVPYPIQLLASYCVHSPAYLLPTLSQRDEKGNVVDWKNQYRVIPQENAFQGKIWVVVSRFSLFPDTQIFLAFLQRNDAATFVGEAPEEWLRTWSRIGPSPAIITRFWMDYSDSAVALFPGNGIPPEWMDLPLDLQPPPVGVSAFQDPTLQPVLQLLEDAS